MAEVVTGRQRICTVAIRAEASQDTRYHLVDIDPFGAHTMQWQSNDDDHSFANCGAFGCTLVVDSQVPNGADRATRATFTAPWIPGSPFVLETDLHPGFVNTSYPANPTPPNVASLVVATVEGTITLTEYADEAEVNPVYERITAYDLEFTTTGAVSIGGATPGSDSETLSDTYTDAAVASPHRLLLSEYGVTFDYLGCFRLNQPNATVAITADGLTYDDRALSAHYEGSIPSGPYYGGSVEWAFDVGGTMLSPTLLWTHETTTTQLLVASLTIVVYPDWALAVNTAALDYETGNPLTPQPGVYHSAWVSDTDPVLVVELDSDGDLRNPPSGFLREATCRVTFNLPTPDIDEYLVEETDNFWHSDADAVLHLFHIDPEWGDAIGRTLRSLNFSGKNDFYNFPIGESYTAATLEFAETHQFGVFDTDSHWNIVSGSPSLAVVGGALEITTGGAAEIWTGTAVAGVFDYALKWFAFRYARIRAKCSVGATSFTLKLTTGTVSPATSYVAEWDLTITDADTWELKELDLLYPDRITDSEVADYAPNHAARFPGGMAVSIECADDVVLTIDYLEGYRKTDGDRTPLLLVAPMSCKGEYGLDGPTGGTTADLDDPAGDVPIFEEVIGGMLWGRLTVNGMRALDFVYGSNDPIDDAWQSFDADYDTAGNDTGLTITNPLPPTLGAFARHFNSYPAPSGPLWQELTAGEEFEVIAQAHMPAYGYFGSGNATTAFYGEEIVLTGRKVWSGEIAGQMSVGHHSAAGVAVELRDNDTDAVIDTASTDDDGLYRLFGPFGEYHPVGNVETGLWSGDPAVYTTTGLRFNSHWYLGARIEHDKDETFHLIEADLERTPAEVYDRYQRWVDFSKVVLADTDMTETANGWLWRVGRIGEQDIIAEYSVDAGKTWVACERIGQSEVAAPTIACDRWDNLFVWWHDATAAYGYRSFDYGGTWELFATHAGMVFPRVALGLGETFLAMHDDATTLTVYRSLDLGETLDETDFTQECPAQLVALELDRRAELHLVYRDDETPTQLWHCWRINDPGGDVWTDAALWADGEFPALAYGQDQRQPPEGGLFGWWDDGALKFKPTDATGTSLGALVESPSQSYEPGYIGLVLSRRSDAFVTGSPPGPDLETVFTGDSLIGWSDP